jgi:hypothetical protein
VSADYSGCCGSCGAFTSFGSDVRLGPVGNCARGMRSYPVTANGTCSEYRLRGAPPVAREEPRSPRRAPARTPDAASFVVRRRPALPEEIDLDMDIDAFRMVLRQVLQEELGVGEAALGSRWQGGELVLKPGREGTAEKKVPIETFFHKIVMVRDKLRVLEQRINASDKLTDEEKVALEQYITGCYGSLTTFNVLFADANEGFKGSGKD